ncbi:hypothetical protein F5884DRAFT_895043 [Xylogone sp. PMI_703]|nr:hypothetical protein F5884DRAFT_895043 [Xylogone sp. PMI_703]
MSDGDRHEKPSTIAGVDQLWKWQLRKEHSALLLEMEKYKDIFNKDEECLAILTKLNEHEEKVTAMAKQSAKKFDEAEVRITQLESTISQLEAQELARTKVAEDIVTKTLQPTAQETSMPTNTKGSPKQTMVVKLKFNPRRMISIQSPIESPRNPVTPAMRILGVSPTTRVSPTQASSVHTATAMPTFSTFKTGEIQPIGFYEQLPKSNSMDNDSIRNMPEKQRPETPQHDGMKDKSVAFMLPKLAQGRSTLDDYITKSQAFAKDVPKEREVEFVAAFIKGIKNVSIRKNLVQQLMSIHPSTTKSNNQVEVICTWLDVEDGLRKANLALLTTPDVPSKKKKRMIIPPQMLGSDC